MCLYKEIDRWHTNRITPSLIGTRAHTHTLSVPPPFSHAHIHHHPSNNNNQQQDDPAWNAVIEAGLVGEVRAYLERHREEFKLGASRWLR